MAIESSAHPSLEDAPRRNSQAQACVALSEVGSAVVGVRRWVWRDAMEGASGNRRASASDRPGPLVTQQRLSSRHVL